MEVLHPFEMSVCIRTTLRYILEDGNVQKPLRVSEWVMYLFSNNFILHFNCASVKLLWREIFVSICMGGSLLATTFRTFRILGIVTHANNKIHSFDGLWHWSIHEINLKIHYMVFEIKDVEKRAWPRHFMFTLRPRGRVGKKAVGKLTKEVTQIRRPVRLHCAR
jgi:hypothetical protein